jgi:HEAT repeat protein
LGELGEAAAGDPALIPSLLDALRNKDVDSDVREAAAKALGRLGEVAANHPMVIPALLDSLNNSSDAGIRQSATKALGALGDAAAYNPAVIHALLSALKDEDQMVCWHAAKALGKLGLPALAKPNVFQAVVDALRGPRSVAWMLGDALGLLPKAAGENPKIIGSALQLLREGALDQRVGALATLERMGEAVAGYPDGIPAIVKALSDEHILVCWAAAKVIANLGHVASAHRGVISALHGVMSRNDPFLTPMAAEALGKLGKAAASDVSVLTDIVRLYQRGEGDVAKALGEWDRQGLRIFRSGDGFTVRTIAELTQPSRT